MSTESRQSLRAFWFYLVQNIKPLFPCSSETLIPVCPLGFINQSPVKKNWQSSGKCVTEAPSWTDGDTQVAKTAHISSLSCRTYKKRLKYLCEEIVLRREAQIKRTFSPTIWQMPCLTGTDISSCSPVLKCFNVFICPDRSAYLLLYNTISDLPQPAFSIPDRSESHHVISLPFLPLQVLLCVF